jgi:hypothetical protein
MAASRKIKDTLYTFKESRFQSLSHELRVYIYGADVTPWLKGDLSVTYGNRDSFNNVSFELANPRKLWQLSKDNLKGNWRNDIGEYSEIEKLGVFRWKNSPTVNPYFNLSISTTTLGNKTTDSGPTNATNPGPTYLKPAEDDVEYRYRLAVNDCIFTRGDPMRIFMRNPYSSPTSDNEGQWVEIFCGFLNDHPITTNYLTGESTLRATGYCIRHLLTKMRVRTAVTVATNDPTPLFNNGFFQDFIASSKATHPFPVTTLENTIKSLILGTETPVPGEVLIGQGIGSFKLGNIVCYNPGEPGQTLEQWHLMTIFGVNKVAYPTGGNDDLWLTSKEMDAIGRSTLYLPEITALGPTGRYLHFLLPWEGTGAGALVQATVSQTTTQIEWTTRWEIIRDFASKLDFQVTTSPSGDILVEFPLYGFTPQLYSVKGGPALPALPLAAAAQTAAEFAAANAANAQIASDQVNESIDRGDIPNGIGSLFTFNLHQIEETLNDEAEDFPTILQVDGGLSLAQENIQTTPGFDNLRAYVFSPVLVARFGVITEQMNLPYAGQRGKDAGTTKDAPSPVATRMAKLALIEYMKRLADSATWDGSLVFRPFLFPNRPLWLMRSSRIGLITSVTNRWSIGKSASTNVALHMLMAERYYTDERKIKTAYRLPTGAANTPISYADIWQDSTSENTYGEGNSGVRVTVGTKPPPAGTPANGSPGSTGSGTHAPDKPSSGPVVEVNDPNLYPPFKEAFNLALKTAANQGLSISITSTYRDPEHQADLKRDPEGHHVARKRNGQYVQIAEPWSSAHQYGMAIDISIAGDKRSDYQTFSNICGPNILWGQVYNGDYVHYEWSPPPGKTGRRCQQILKGLGFKLDKQTGQAAGNKGNYLQELWKAFEAQSFGSGSQDPKSSVNVSTEIPKTKTGTEEVKQAAVCSPVRLTKPGLTDLAALADDIARAKKSRNL